MGNNDLNKQVSETLSDKKRGKGRLFRWVIIILAIAYGWHLYFGKQADNSKVVYDVVDAILGDLTVEVTATGTLEPCNQVVVGSELSGIISDIYVDYNDRVKKGQLLARLDVSRLEAQVKQTKASLVSAEARIAQVEATVNEAASKLEQVENLYKISKGKAPSQASLDEVRAAFARAKAEHESAVAARDQVQAALDISENELRKADIISPIDGIVLSRRVEVGQTVAAALQSPVLFELADDLAALELHVDVDEADIGMVRDGQTADFTVPAYTNQHFPAKITQVRFAPDIIAGVVTYETLLDVNNDELLLRPGMTATAQIIVKEIDDALLVPGSALRYTPPAFEKDRPKKLTDFLPKPPQMDKPKEVHTTGGDQQRLWVLRDDVPVAVDVSVGVTNGEKTEIVEGDLKPGDKIIIDTLTVEK